MIIKTLKVGSLETNCYLLFYDGEVIIIDPGAESEKIKKEIGNKKVKTILITHNHFDHIGALEELQRFYNVKVNAYNLVDNMQVINTPGHTKDSKTFYFKKEHIMFCGDFLFKDSFGRTDLETGSNADMINSLNLIRAYPDDITLYPGHEEVCNLGQEKSKFAQYIAYLKKC